MGGREGGWPGGTAHSWHVWSDVLKGEQSLTSVMTTFIFKLTTALSRARTRPRRSLLPRE